MPSTSRPGSFRILKILMLVGVLLGYALLSSAPDSGRLGALPALQWTAPAGCPSAAEIEASVRQLIGNDPIGQGVSASAQVREIAAGFELELRVSDETRPRIARAPQCEELGLATALVVATLHDPVRAASTVFGVVQDPPLAVEPPPAPDNPEIEVDSATRPEGPRTPETQTTRNSPTRRHYYLRLEGVLGRATSPGLEHGVGVAFSGEQGPIRLELNAEYLPPTHHDHPTLDGVALEMQLVAANLAACGVAKHKVWAFPVCARLRGGAALARGSGRAVRRGEWRAGPYIGAAAGASAIWRRWRTIAPWLGIEGVVNVSRTQFGVLGSSPFVRSPRGGIPATIGFEFALL